jgi:hypothetical protein
MEYNLYCDESCHLEHDNSNVMVLGALILPKVKKDEISRNILGIKNRYGLKPHTEVKWTKASPAKANLYIDLVDYFFFDDDLRFRVLIADKRNLSHLSFRQTHNDWYYKMYFQMLNMLFDPADTYYVYIDIKDTHSAERAKKLWDICSNSHYDFDHKSIKRIQPIRSDEVQMMQITDILNGAVCRINRTDVDAPRGAKQQIIEQIRNKSGLKLTQSTTYGARKFNVFCWEGHQK